MASDLETIHYICDQAGLGPRLTYRRMFGEYALYVDEKVVAFVCDDQLFVKPTPAGAEFLGELTLAPPYPGAKDYFLLNEELEDPDRLKEVLLVTAAAVPPPKPKAGRKPKNVAKR